MGDTIKPMTDADFDRMSGQLGSTYVTPTTSHPLPERRVSTSLADNRELAGRKRVTSSFSAAIYGAADTLTFGFLDEAGAAVDSSLPLWAGGTGETYDEALRSNRAALGLVEEEYSKSYFGGQLAGGFVPLWGWAGRGRTAATTLTTVGTRAAASGAVYGGLYGLGSSKSNDIFSFERAKDAAIGGLIGAGGGFVLGVSAQYVGGRVIGLYKSGKVPKIPSSFIPDPVVRKPIPGKEPKAPTKGAQINQAAKKVEGMAEEAAPSNTLTGKAIDQLEEGAVVTGAELFSKRPGAAVAAAFDRVTKLSPEAAKDMADSFDAARAAGELVDDPHYRSLLGVEGVDDLDDALRAATAIEEIEQAIRDRAGFATKKSMDQIEADARAAVGPNASEAALDDAVARFTSAATDVNIAQNMSMLAGVKYAQSVNALLPDVLKGVEGSMEALQEAIVTSIRITAKANVIKSEAGRALGVLSQKRSLVHAELHDAAVEVEDPATIAKQVAAALKQMDDMTLADTLGNLRTMDDVTRVQEILLNADAAKALSFHRRAMNSVGLYIKSNLLTPLTGVISAISIVGHDFLRNDMARKWAINGFRIAGQADEALKLQFERQVMRSTYWAAHMHGLNAMMSRLKWEALDTTEKVFGVLSANSKVALRASTSRRAMLSNGYAPPSIFEFDKSARAAVTDVAGFNADMAAKYGDGDGMSSIFEAATRLGAGALNALDGAGTAVGRVVTGTLDDWGRSFVRMKETQAQAARFAINEAMTQAPLQGWTEKQMFEYAGNRVTELMKKPHADLLLDVEKALLRGADQTAEQKFLLGVDRATNKEAEAVLFTDSPQTSVGRGFQSLATNADAAVSLPLSALAMASSAKVREEVKKHGIPLVSGLLIPYIKTPTRILERGLISYTPWAGMFEESRKIIARGGAEAAMEKARIEMGTMGIALGAIASATGIITVTNGGWENTKNLDGSPPQRINLPGGGHVEMGRMDPLATTLALGGMIGQALKTYQEHATSYTADEALETALAVAAMSLRETVLEKSYMTGIRDLMKAVFGDQGGSPLDLYKDILSSSAIAAIPGSGTMRQIGDTAAGHGVESISFVDKLFRVTPGLSSYLPARVDILGDPVEGRTMGLAAGVSGSDDPIRQKLTDLGIDLKALGKVDPSGLRLTSEELSELRRIRGHEATDKWGRTMRETLGDLFNDPYFNSLPTLDQKRAEIMDALRPYNEAAREIYEERNPTYQADRAGAKAFLDYLYKDGMTPNAAEAAATEEVVSSGLPTPQRMRN